MMKIKISLLFLIILFICSCSKTTNLSSAGPHSSEVEYNVKTLYPNGIPESETLLIQDAIGNVIDKFTDFDNEKTKYSVERADLINSRIYYIIRRFEDRPEHIVTLGYYAVDVFTGEVFDTKYLTDLVKLE